MLLVVLWSFVGVFRWNKHAFALQSVVFVHVCGSEWTRGANCEEQQGQETPFVLSMVLCGFVVLLRVRESELENYRDTAPL